MKDVNQNGAPAMDASGNVVIGSADRRRLRAEDKATEALYMLALLGDLVDSARDGELTLTAESTQGMCITLAHAQKAVRDLLDVLAAERMEEARARAEAGAETEA